jgi:hypothetical protein
MAMILFLTWGKGFDSLINFLPQKIYAFIIYHQRNYFNQKAAI